MELKSKINTIIFDLDGTLIDSIHGIAFSLNEILKKRGFEMHSANKIKTFIGNGRRELIKKSIPKEFRSEENINTLFREMDILYKLNWDYKMSPFPETISLLELLMENEVSININTSKDENTTKLILEKYFPTIEFDYIVGNDTLLSKKPNPGGIDYIVNKLNISKSSCLYIGDSEVDIKTANNANVDCISVTWGYRSKYELIDNGSKTLVNNVTDLMNIIMNNKK